MKVCKVLVPAVVILVVAAIVGAFYFRSRQTAHSLTDKDTIVLADFTNTTGDAVFDDTLKTALNVSLRQSPFLNVLSDSGVEDLEIDDPPRRHETHARDGPRALPACGQQGLHRRIDCGAGQPICAGIKGRELPKRRPAGTGTDHGGC